MTLARFVSSESRLELAGLLGVATIAGASSLLALALVNAVAMRPEDADLRAFLAYAGLVSLHILTARTTYHRMMALLEDALHRLRLRLVGEIVKADLERLEKVGSARLLDRITSNLSGISRAGDVIANLLQSAFIVVVAIGYLAWLSPVALALVVLFCGGAYLMSRIRGALVTALWRRQAGARLRYRVTLTGLLKGAKEIKLHRDRGRSVMDEHDAVAEDLRRVATTANRVYYDNNLFMTTNLYLLLVALAFVLPQHTPIDGPLLSGIIAAVLFVWASARAVVDLYPSYLKARLALAELDQLEVEMTTLQGGEAGVDPWQEALGPIRIEGLHYRYPAAEGARAFAVGPLDLVIGQGETVFIAGGNGSGKSTLLKLITGLYRPGSGTISMGEHAVRHETVAAYRERISAIFSDSYLFSKVYGMLDVEPDRVHELLDALGLRSKTTFQDGRFSSRDLSTGQKKRLALVVALLEDRPILALDEWAADQDPGFRRTFYERLIPRLKAQGKTIIAISHDARYFHHADRVIFMEDGRLKEDRGPKSQGMLDVPSTP